MGLISRVSSRTYRFRPACSISVYTMPFPMVRNVHSNRTAPDISQDIRFKCKHQKLLKKLLVHNNIKNVKKRSVNMKKVKIDTIKPWISEKLLQMLGFDDEIVFDYLVNQLTENQFPDPREVQINITGFINGKNAKEFIGELWPMLVSATENGLGVPDQILNAKKSEIQARAAAGAPKVSVSKSDVITLEDSSQSKRKSRFSDTPGSSRDHLADFGKSKELAEKEKAEKIVVLDENSFLVKSMKKAEDAKNLSSKIDIDGNIYGAHLDRNREIRGEISVREQAKQKTLKGGAKQTAMDTIEILSSDNENGPENRTINSKLVKTIPVRSDKPAVPYRLGQHNAMPVLAKRDEVIMLADSPDLEESINPVLLKEDTLDENDERHPDFFKAQADRKHQEMLLGYTHCKSKNDLEKLSKNSSNKRSIGEVEGGQDDGVKRMKPEEFLRKKRKN